MKQQILDISSFDEDGLPVNYREIAVILNDQK
jgi:hypothetical protein